MRPDKSHLEQALIKTIDRGTVCIWIAERPKIDVKMNLRVEGDIILSVCLSFSLSLPASNDPLKLNIEFFRLLAPETGRKEIKSLEGFEVTSAMTDVFVHATLQNIQQNTDIYIANY